MSKEDNMKYNKMTDTVILTTLGLLAIPFFMGFEIEGEMWGGWFWKLALWLYENGFHL